MSLCYIPSQIEDAVVELALPNGYGTRCGMYDQEHHWILDQGQTLEEAIKEAKERYMMPPANDEFHAMSLSSNDPEFDSLSDTSVEEYFSVSVCEDNECPDSESLSEKED